MHEKSDDERILISSDDDLDRRRRTDDYVINRIVKYAILVLSLIVMVAVTAIVLWAVITQQQWREYAIRSVFQALPGIVAVVLVVLGLKNLRD